MSISKILAQKGKWLVNLDKSIAFQANLCADYDTNLLEEQKIIWRKKLEYELGKDTFFVFENGIFLEFYNEKDYCKKLSFIVDEQEKSIKIYKTETCEGNYILKFDILEMTKKTFVFYVSEDDSYDDFSHHHCLIYCDFIPQN